MNNKSSEKQVDIMKASNKQNLFQKLLWFLYILYIMLQELGQNRKNKLDLRCHKILKICPN